MRARGGSEARTVKILMSNLSKNLNEQGIEGYGGDADKWDEYT